MAPDLTQQPIWRPTPEQVERSEITRFRRFAQGRTGQRFASYGDLHRWSVDDSAAFWELLAEFAQVDFSRSADRIKGPDRMPGTRWFDGALLNYAENLLRIRGDRTAIITATEAGHVRRYSYGEVYSAVAGFAGALTGMGVGAGDRVGGYVANGAEAIIALLGCAAVGAVWSACSPDFGAAAAVDRLGQIGPKVLLASDQYEYGGKRIDCLPSVRRIAASIDTLERVIVIPYDPESSPELDDGWDGWREVLGDGPADEISYAQLPFDHPLYILFSSGTTGAPKCMVHGAGGTLLQHRKEHLLHTDMGMEDVLFYFTTCGWMMWNWLASALAGGTTIVLYDGSPAYPDLTALWRLAAKVGVTVFGTSATFVEACMKAGISPRSVADLSLIRTVLSTGSPLSAAGFQWISDEVGSRVQTSSISGGTDIVSCFVLGSPNLPVYAGQIQCIGLGMDVAAVDARGNDLVGEKGELICRRPFPSMPVHFWNDPDGSKYHEAYFAEYPGWWRHGDFIEIGEQGGVVIHGRSDATLNVGGVRIGTAELYRPLETLSWVRECLAVERLTGTYAEIVLFVVAASGGVTADQEAELRTLIRREASPRHVPRRIFAVPDIPRTRNGKKAELAVKSALEGKAVPNLQALANPECLDRFAEIGRELSGEGATGRPR